MRAEGAVPADLVVRAARALIGGAFVPAAVVVRAGTIDAVLDAEAPVDAAQEVRLAADEVLLPGLVDTHVHVNEPGRTEWEGFASATAAAAAGGVTTLVDMPLNSIPATTTPQALALKREAASRVGVDVGFWGGAVPQNLGRLGALHEAGVFGFKAFLSPSGVPEFDHLDGTGLLRALAEVAELGSLLIVHAEDPALLVEAVPPGRSYPAFAATRPAASEVAAITALIAGMRATGARAHVLHLSAAQALGPIRAARAEGLPLTVETCPHYLCFAAEAVPEGATAFKCCPPIRDERNRELLWEALADGTIDVVVSDHSPATAALKLAGDGDFGVAWGGVAGLQVAFAAVADEARRRGYGLADVVRWTGSGPAALVGLGHKGAIRAGGDADLVVYAPDEPWTVDVATLAHRNAVSAWHGRALTGRVRRSWVRGAVAGIPGAGQLLSRQASSR